MTERNCLVLGTLGREVVHTPSGRSPLNYGGTAFHASAAIKRAGRMNPIISSVVGTDITLAELSTEFGEGLVTSGIQTVASMPSFYWEARYSDDLISAETLKLENRILERFIPNWNNLAKQIDSIDAIYLGAFDPHVQSLCAASFGSSFKLAETLGYWIDRSEVALLAALSNADAVILTQAELEQLFQLPLSPMERSDAIQNVRAELAIEFLFITFGDSGSRAVSKFGDFFVPAIDTSAVDPTGAGNAYAGGILSALPDDRVFDLDSLVVGVTLGHALAACQVSGYGTEMLSRVSSEQISDLAKALQTEIQWL